MEEYRKRVQISSDIFLSVIRSPYSYGGSEGLFEVALISKEGDLITHRFFPDHEDDVIGWLTFDNVTEVIKEVEKLLPL